MDGARRAAPDPALAAVKTWRYLRLAMIVLVAALLAAVLHEHARAPGGCWQPSISAYWYTPAQGALVGALVAIGVCLVCLKSSTEGEDLLLNLAGICAPVVALVPTPDAGGCSSVPAATAGRDAAVATSVTALLAAGGLALGVVGVLTAVRLTRGGRQRPGRTAVVGYAVVTALWAAALGVFLGARGWFVGHGHVVAAGAMFGLVFLTVCLDAVDFRTSRTARRVNRYAWVAAGMAAAAVAHVVLLLTLDWAHWALSLETSLIVLFAVFWVLQTVELWNEGLRRRPPLPSRTGSPG
ncbi:hypothetical protein [Modestobacter sp. NPDC049651]|uniref:hypothetical protein n=1 Tax=unclassified Modestobacter TaxID=2643866 RepID=UPI0033FCCD3A